jgi:hypothetical protein
MADGEGPVTNMVKIPVTPSIADARTFPAGDGQQRPELFFRECPMMTNNRFILFVLAILGAASSACSVYVDSSREQCKQDIDCAALGAEYAGYICKDSICQSTVPQCVQASDCAALGAEYAGYICKDSVCQAVVDPTWACLDKPGITEPPSGNVHVVLTLVDLLSQKPLAGASLALCAKIDANCTLPISLYQSNPGGQIDVEMPAGIDVYFQVEGVGIHPTLLFPPSTRKQRAPSTIPMVPASFYPTLIKGGPGVAPDRSVILTTALDCLGRPAAGVTLSSPQADGRRYAGARPVGDGRDRRGGIPQHPSGWCPRQLNACGHQSPDRHRGGSDPSRVREHGAHHAQRELNHGSTDLITAYHTSAMCA